MRAHEACASTDFPPENMGSLYNQCARLAAHSPDEARDACAYLALNPSMFVIGLDQPKDTAATFTATVLATGLQPLPPSPGDAPLPQASPAPAATQSARPFRRVAGRIAPPGTSPATPLPPLPAPLPSIDARDTWEPRVHSNWVHAPTTGPDQVAELTVEPPPLVSTTAFAPPQQGANAAIARPATGVDAANARLPPGADAATERPSPGAVAETERPNQVAVHHVEHPSLASTTASAPLRQGVDAANARPSPGFDTATARPFAGADAATARPSQGAVAETERPHQVAVRNAHLPHLSSASAPSIPRQGTGATVAGPHQAARLPTPPPPLGYVVVRQHGPAPAQTLESPRRDTPLLPVGIMPARRAGWAPLATFAQPSAAADWLIDLAPHIPTEWAPYWADALHATYAGSGANSPADALTRPLDVGGPIAGTLRYLSVLRPDIADLAASMHAGLLASPGPTQLRGGGTIH